MWDRVRTTRRFAHLYGAHAGRLWIMALPAQTISLLEAARQLSKDLRTDAVLLLTETKLDWAEVRERLGRSRLLVAAHDPDLTRDLRGRDDCVVLELDSAELPM